ncbi:MAG: hypothetical protein KDD47_10935 [Acidobacteria bacterium]|nr:hypothetical protein [Acidobacteriota bacterium]
MTTRPLRILSLLAAAALGLAAWGLSAPSSGPAGTEARPATLWVLSPSQALGVAAETGAVVGRLTKLEDARGLVVDGERGGGVGGFPGTPRGAVACGRGALLGSAAQGPERGTPSWFWCRRRVRCGWAGAGGWAASAPRASG